MSRPQSGRVVAGVAAGLAQNLGVSALSVRIALTALTLLGGWGRWPMPGCGFSRPRLTTPSSPPQPLSSCWCSWRWRVVRWVCWGFGASLAWRCHWRWCHRRGAGVVGV
ncbi:PspC domain-containing protein [Corynebacterium sp. Marseille-Q2823]|uniref:PspC domain-containing protein n=1 Tax=Corynebacterium sp. Marseille-Q2823 TaxID=2736606 RepID=UPI0020CA354F|nr:PspC domain-containing protein [Corynebacterium sp. Marseille-Q2823]